MCVATILAKSVHVVVQGRSERVAQHLCILYQCTKHKQIVGLAEFLSLP